MITVYGIKNCSTMKKAFDWFEAHELEYQFHDYKKSGVSPQTVHVWVEQLGLDVVLNKRGTTWRKLPDEAKQKAEDAAAACQLMSENPSMIKRPIVAVPTGDTVKFVAGFNPEAYVELLKL